MKQIFVAIFICLFTNLALADNASLEGGIVVGTAISDNSASRTDTLDASSATRRNAYGWLAPVSCTVDQVCVYVSSRTGSPGATDGVLAIYSDTNGAPNASLSSGTFDVTSTGFKCSTQSQAVTAGTQYWFHITNANGTPGSNYFGIWQGPENFVYAAGSHGTQQIGPAMCRSTDNGATWSALNRVGSAAYRVHCSSGTYYGFPATSDDTPNNPIASGDRVYSSQEVGNLFTTPSNAKMNVRCIRMRGAKATGTPTGFIRFRLYTGTTLTATTDSLASVGMTTNPGALQSCFSSAQTLSAATQYRVVMAETAQSDTSSNAYGPHRIDWDANASSQALKPFNGTIQKTVWNGSSWTDTTGSFYEMQLLLDPGNEFSTSGGGLLRHPGMNGGFGG